MKSKYILFLVVLILSVGFTQALCAQEEGQTEIGQETIIDVEASTGRISLDIKGMEVVDVLKILAMRSDLNIVAGKNVGGKVTVFLKDVGIIDALEIILASNGLAYENKAGIINVMTEKEYELLYGEKSYDRKETKTIQLKFAKAVEVGKSLDQIKSKIGKVVVDEGSNSVVLIDIPQKISQMEEAVKNMDLPLLTKTFILNYAKAEDLQDKIRECLTKNIGELRIDERMNKIVVTDLAEKIDYITRIISDFDERDKVVLIEAKIVQITLDKNVGYGINWNNIFGGIDTIVQSDLDMNLTGTTPTTTFTYNNSNASDQAILSLLETVGKTDVLSNPRITVSNNHEAKILVGTREAYITSTVTQSDGTTTTADNVEFVNVGVNLAVTPVISEDGYINMKIRQEVSSAPTSLELTNADGSTRTSVPIVTTSEAQTQLLIKDGVTIILAGLMQDTRKDNTEKIPILGDIPFLGRLFRSSGKGDEKTELMIFLTPHIVKKEEDSSQDFEEYLRQHQKIGVDAEESPSISSKVSVQPKSFRQYCEYVSDEVNKNLRKNTPKRIKKQEVRLSFVLSSDGRLKEKPKFLNKVSRKVRSVVIKSIKGASPFAPFPKDYGQTEETFRLNISFD